MYSIMNKSFKEYLQESISNKKYEFRIKIANEVSPEQENLMKMVLGRYTEGNEPVKLKKLSKTPIQALPLDFPQLKNVEVSIYEITLDYPTTQQELTEKLTQELKIPRNSLVVRRPGEPSEEYQEEKETRTGALLHNPNYEESPNAKFEDYYGDKYNSGFVKELNDVLKQKRKERGEKIPETEPAKFNTDTPANTKSNVQQAKDPRKK